MGFFFRMETDHKQAPKLPNKFKNIKQDNMTQKLGARDGIWINAFWHEGTSRLSDWEFPPVHRGSL